MDLWKQYAGQRLMGGSRNGGFGGKILVVFISALKRRENALA